MARDARVLVWIACLLTWIASPSLAQENRASAVSNPKSQPAVTTYAELRVIDASTGHGIPLVELESVNGMRFVTDNAGRVAFHEPGLMETEVFLTVRSHGYTIKPDGFGFKGRKWKPRAGEVTTWELDRVNLAERLCRLTGEGLYRDTALLGYPLPEHARLLRARIMGQDSVQAARYKERLFWIWGDTLRVEYPLGLFRTAGAVTPIIDPSHDEETLRDGIDYQYFVDEKSGFARNMMPHTQQPQGVIWLSALFTVKDEQGNEKLMCHYSRRKGLAEELEQGIAEFNDATESFESVRELPLEETWRHPHGNVVYHSEADQSWLLFGSPLPNVRVPARRAAVLDPKQYEALTCFRKQADQEAPSVDRDREGVPQWRWQRELPPLDSEHESRLIREGQLEPMHARCVPANVAEASERVVLHRGTVRWNPYRDRWVMIANQSGGKSSYLGEVWYSEADQPTGPFPRAIKVATHDRQSFYNPCHHDFLDRENGRWIHFEGTYTRDFSGNPERTPRYDYNQILYRLDLSQMDELFGKP